MLGIMASRTTRLEFFWPIPLSPLILALVGCAGLSWLHSHALAGWAYADWIGASAEFRQGTVFAGPWMAGCACWVASMTASKRSLVYPCISAKRGGRLVFSQCSALATAGVAGYLLGLAPVLIYCFHNATWANLNLWVAASGLVSLVAFTCLGYCCGVMIPRLLAFPAILVLLILTTYLMPEQGSILFPTYPFDVEAGLSEPTGISLYRIVFFAAIALAMLTVASLEQREPEGHLFSSNDAVPATLSLLLPVVLGVVAWHVHPALIAHDTTAKASCRVSHKSVVCVQPARATMLTPLARILTREQSSVRGGGVTLHGVYDATLWRTIGATDLSLQIQGQDSRSWQAFAARDIAAALSGAFACQDNSSSGDGRASPASISSEAVGVWLVDQAGFRGAVAVSSPGVSRLADRLMAAAPADRLRFAREHLRKIADCDGRFGMFPGH
jgi:hypothetical protein